MPARTAIGLDIGTSGVRAAELSYGRNGVTLERFGQIALPEGAVRDGEVVDRDAVADAVRTLWKGSGFSGRKVALGVANQRVVVRQVDLPWLPERELKDSLPLQVQDYLPLPVEECVIDFHPVAELRQEGSRLLRGLLVAAAREMVSSNVDAVHAAGLTATSVDLTSFAVLRSVGSPFGEAATEVLVDIGARVTNLVVHSGGVPRFVRVLLSGGQDVTDALVERLGVSPEIAEAVKRRVDAPEVDELLDDARSLATIEATIDGFVEDVRTSINYYSASHPQYGVERVVVTGGGSQLPGIVEALAAATRLDVAVGNPIAPLHLGSTGLDDQQIQQIQPLSAVPVGLALGAIS